MTVKEVIGKIFWCGGEMIESIDEKCFFCGKQQKIPDPNIFGQFPEIDVFKEVIINGIFGKKMICSECIKKLKNKLKEERGEK